MEYCENCTDHEECRAAGCSNPRKHPMQKDVTPMLRSSVIMAQEDYIAVDDSVCSYPIRWRWSDWTSGGRYLEVMTVDGWSEVYPLIQRVEKEDGT